MGTGVSLGDDEDEEEEAARGRLLPRAPHRDRVWDAEFQRFFTAFSDLSMIVQTARRKAAVSRLV